MKAEYLDDVLGICERLCCTLQELPSRLSSQELQLWLARSILHPRSSPDRWYAKITAALIKKPDHESLLPNCSRLSTLQFTLRDIKARASKNAEALFNSIVNLFGAK